MIKNPYSDVKCTKLTWIRESMNFTFYSMYILYCIINIMKKVCSWSKRFLKEFINITLQSEFQPHISDIISFP